MLLATHGHQDYAAVRQAAQLCNQVMLLRTLLAATQEEMVQCMLAAISRRTHKSQRLTRFVCSDHYMRSPSAGRPQDALCTCKFVPHCCSQRRWGLSRHMVGLCSPLP